jgi:hypothetical protein
VITWTNGTAGTYQFANLTSAPEYPSYERYSDNASGPKLSLDQTTLLTSSDFATYGLNNPINAAKLAVVVAGSTN